MKLDDLIKGITLLDTQGDRATDITGINIDSRQITAGDLFVAIRGTQSDGHAYIGKAIERGAKAILCEKLPATLQANVCYMQTPDTEAVVGLVATRFFGDPTSKLQLIGVTGTNGKTTIATLLYKVFQKFGYKCGLCSTVCNYIDDEAIPTEHTTPDPITLNRLLGKMADEGCKYAFMEVSSHAIAQKRIGGLRFAGGIFTNLTRDHLDYHKTFENYRDAKKAFFDALPSDAFAITNADDRNGMIMVQNTRADVKTYSLRALADYKAKILEETFEGMLLDVDGREVGVQFIGRFNVSNLLAVYSAAMCLGKKPEDILVALSLLRPVNGRFETIRSAEGVTAIVDYAHTPDALTNVLTTINEIRHGKGEVITVCGAGGNRDKGKRPLMAQEAVKHSTKVILTSDNPRNEEPQDIIDDMLAGLDSDQLKQVVTITDRKEAIRTACLIARPGDVILVAGKGHEDYQEIKGVKYHFDDHEVIKSIFGIR